MATVTKSIREGGDYTTIVGWEADLSNFSGDDCIGELYDDAPYSETFLIDDTTPNTVTLSVASGNRHDGTAGSGARINGGGVVNRNSVTSEWFEVYGSGANTSGSNWALYGTVGNGGNYCIFRSLILHDIQGISYGSYTWGLKEKGWRAYIVNNFVYDIHTPGASYHICRGIGGAEGIRPAWIWNNTVYDITPTGSANTYGLTTGAGQAPGANIQNNLVCGSGTSDYYFDWGSTYTATNNLSSDATAPGTSSLTSKAAADQFVSIVSESEDLHLQAGSDAIGTGVDLGTGGGREVDIDGRDRDAEGDTWDIGADQFVASAAAGGAWSMSRQTLSFSNRKRRR